MLEFEYVVETGPDGIRWLSLEPIMADIVKALDGLMNLPTETLDDEGKHLIEMKILGLRTVHEFLGSIITADNIKKLKGYTNENKKETIH